MKCKIYLSDEGFGHLVRQRAIYQQLCKLDESFKATIQTSSYANVAKKIFNDAKFITKFNNIHWAKQKNGSPDLEMIHDFFENYEVRSNQFIESEIQESEHYDFFISDVIFLYSN